MLYIFGGLPGTGKSTLAVALARQLGACYLRIDTIEQAMRTGGIAIDGPAGYIVAYQIARDNLRLGHDVVADSVNPLAITRSAWTDIASQEGADYIEIEVVCSDIEEHQRRVETRQSDIPGLLLPSWHKVATREYELWESEHITIDTAGETPAASSRRLLEKLQQSVVGTTEPYGR